MVNVWENLGFGRDYWLLCSLKEEVIQFCVYVNGMRCWSRPSHLGGGLSTLGVMHVNTQTIRLFLYWEEAHHVDIPRAPCKSVLLSDRHFIFEKRVFGRLRRRLEEKFEESIREVGNGLKWLKKFPVAVFSIIEMKPYNGASMALSILIESAFN